MPVASRLAALALASALLVATSAARAECPRTFRFATPADWRCAEEGTPQCTICRNRSLHPTELVVHCVADGSEEHRAIPPGGTVAICGGQPS